MLWNFTPEGLLHPVRSVKIVAIGMNLSVTTEMVRVILSALKTEVREIGSARLFGRLGILET